MDLRETPTMSGVLTLELHDAHGVLLERRHIPNLITLKGKLLLAYFLMGRVNAMPTRWAIAVGTGQSEPRLQDTALEHQVDEAKVSASGVDVVERDGQPGVRARMTATLPALALAPTEPPQPLAEAGILLTLDANTPLLFNRVRFDPIHRGAQMVVKLTWEIWF